MVQKKAWNKEPSTVCIIGCGAVTALGVDAPMTAASVRGDLSLFKESYMVDRYGEPMVLSMAEFIDDDVGGLERLVALAAPAAQEALLPLVKAGLIDTYKEIPLYLGTAAARPGFNPQIGQDLIARVVNDTSLTPHGDKQFLCAEGHAAALMAMAGAAEQIESGREELALVGGVDSYYDADTLEWLDESKRLHSEANKDGFVPGEGAGFCLLTSQGFAKRHQIEPLGLIVSNAIAEEPYPFYSEGVCIGQGMTRVLRDVLSILVPRKLVADWVICDMNGESFRGTEWMYAYLRTGSMHRDPLEIWHPADCYGDIGAASGAVLVAIAIRAWQRNYARGERCLIWTSSDGKHRSAVLLQPPLQQ